MIHERCSIPVQYQWPSNWQRFSLGNGSSALDHLAGHSPAFWGGIPDDNPGRRCFAVAGGKTRRPYSESATFLWRSGIGHDRERAKCADDRDLELPTRDLCAAGRIDRQADSQGRQSWRVAEKNLALQIHPVRFARRRLSSACGNGESRLRRKSVSNRTHFGGVISPQARQGAESSAACIAN